MPTSWYQAIPAILTQVKKLEPATILDIGVGFGKYGLLFRDVLEIPWERYHKKDWNVTIEGVEAFPAYHNPVYDFAYDKVHFGNILELIDTLPNYDCITLIDVIEHFSKEEGLLLTEKLIAHCNKGLIVSTPLYPDHQEDYLGNGFEQHKSVWSIADFERFNFTYERINIEKNGAHIFCFQKNRAYVKMPFEELSATKSQKQKPLRIAYYLPHKNLTGGMKMLLQQMKHLRERGHHMIALMKDVDGSQTALPDWFDLAVDEEVLVPAGTLTVDHLPACDIIVAGWITQLIELKDSTIPVVYWEQGNEWLFGDIKDQRDMPTISAALDHCYLSKHAILSVSPFVANRILARFGRKTPILSNGIDTTFYAVGEKSGTNKILLVGNPFLPFKGFASAFKALEFVWKAGYRFHVEWVCQAKPRLPEVSFPISLVLRPSQEELVKCYQSADIHVFPSWYEGFGMPPLEAMSCGTAVVCTKCGGISTFVKEHDNAFVADAGDIPMLAANIATLLKYPHIRELLGANGRKTAQDLDYSKIILDLESYLYQII